MMPSPDMPQRVDSRAAIRGIAEVIGSKYYPPGQLAELRRLQPEAPRGAAFWRLLLDHAPESVGNPALECDWSYAGWRSWSLTTSRAKTMRAGPWVRPWLRRG
jgi:hypothetical protein